VSPQEEAMADRAIGAIYAELKRAAILGLPCPTDTELFRKAGLNTRDQAQWRVRKLIDLGLVSSTQAYEDGIPRRVITIAPSRWAGAAAGKFSALPKKWAALRSAAKSEVRA
jgi:hypothetical protein